MFRHTCAIILFHYIVSTVSEMSCEQMNINIFNMQSLITILSLHILLLSYFFCFSLSYATEIVRKFQNPHRTLKFFYDVGCRLHPALKVCHIKISSCCLTHCFTGLLTHPPSLSLSLPNLYPSLPPSLPHSLTHSLTHNYLQ